MTLGALVLAVGGVAWGAQTRPGTQHTASAITRASATPHASPSTPGSAPGTAVAGLAHARPRHAAPVPPVPAGCTRYAGSQRIACVLLPSFGFPTSQMPPLVSLWNGESGWRTDARNANSGAYGIPQALPGRKMAGAGADWRTSPATQIRWGLGYIRSTYGTPARAWAVWRSRSPHWY